MKMLLVNNNLLKKIIIGCFVFTSFVCSSCDNWLTGDDFLLELDQSIKNANSNEAVITIKCDAEKRKTIVPQVGPLASGGKKEGSVIELEFEESDAYIFEKWTVVPEGSVSFENEKERNTKATIISSKEDITIEPVCVKKCVLTVNFWGEHGSTNPYEQKKYFSEESFLLSYRAESDYGFTKWEILDSDTKQVMENPPVKIIGTGTEVNVEVLAMESDMEITVKAVAVRRPSIISYSPDWNENGEDSSQTITVMFSQKINTTDISNYITIVDRSTQENLLDCFSEPSFDSSFTTLRIYPKKDKLLPKDTEIVVTFSGDLCDENQIKLGSDFTWTYKVNGKGDLIPGSFNELTMYAASNAVGMYIANKDVVFDKKEQDFETENNIKTYNLVGKKIILTGSVVDEGTGPDFVTWKLSKIHNQFYPTENSSEVIIVPERQIAPEFLNASEKVAFFQNNGTNPTIDLSNDITESGVYKLSITMTDKSANVSAPTDFFFVYDVTAPEVMNLSEYRYLDNQTRIDGNLDKCKDFDKVVISICGYETGGEGIDEHEDIVVDDNRYGTLSETIYNIKQNYSYEFNFVAYDKAGNSKKFKLEKDTTPLPHIDVNDITVKTFAKDVVKVTFPVVPQSMSSSDFDDYWKTEITVKEGQDFNYVAKVMKRSIPDASSIVDNDLVTYKFFGQSNNTTDVPAIIQEIHSKEKEICAFRKIENTPNFFNNFSTEGIEFDRKYEDFEIIKDLNFKRLDATLIITDYDFAGNKTETEVQIKSQMDVGMYYHMDGYWAYDNHGEDTSKYLDYPVGVIIDVDSESGDNTGTIISYRIKNTRSSVFPETTRIADLGQYSTNADADSTLLNYLITNKIAVRDDNNLTNPDLVSTDGYANTYKIIDNEIDKCFKTNQKETFWEVIQEENMTIQNAIPDFKWYLPSVYEALNIIEKVNEMKDYLGLNLNSSQNPIVCSNFVYDENSKSLKRYCVAYDSSTKKVTDYKDTQTRTCFFAKVNPDW